jgi:hypothetical protein
VRTGRTLTTRPVCTMVAPIRPGEVRPETGDRCPRCHRTAPRSDGIPCGLCSPYGPTTIDENGVTHDWDRPCLTVQARQYGPETEICRFYPVVSGSPVDCMTCLVRVARRT